MDEPALIAVVAVVAVVLVSGVVWRATRRSDARDPLAPARLGPSWAPTDDDEPQAPPIDPSARQDEIREVAASTGLDVATVRTVLAAWDEYRAVLGLASLPRDHRYRSYDPYVPPVAERGPDGPIPDRDRVARDVASRSSVTQLDALAILEADAALARERGATSSDHEAR